MLVEEVRGLHRDLLACGAECDELEIEHGLLDVLLDAADELLAGAAAPDILAAGTFAGAARGIGGSGATAAALDRGERGSARHAGRAYCGAGEERRREGLAISSGKLRLVFCECPTYIFSLHQSSLLRFSLLFALSLSLAYHPHPARCAGRAINGDLHDDGHRAEQTCSGA